MFCGKCGSQYPDGNSFCLYCGAPATDTAPEEPQLRGKLLKQSGTASAPTAQTPPPAYSAPAAPAYVPPAPVYTPPAAPIYPPPVAPAYAPAAAPAYAAPVTPAYAPPAAPVAPAYTPAAAPVHTVPARTYVTSALDDDPDAGEKKATVKKIVIAAVIAALALAIGIGAWLVLPKLFGTDKNPEEPIEHFYSYLNNSDYAELEKCFPEDYLDTALPFCGIKVEDFKKEQQERAKREDAPVFTYQIQGSEPIAEDRLEALCKELNEQYGNFFDPEKLTGVSTYKLLSGVENKPVEVVVFCYGGNWYLHPDALFHSYIPSTGS